MTEFVYAPGGVIAYKGPANSTLSDLVRVGEHEYVPPRDWEHRERARNAALNVYELRTVGAPVDDWQEKFDERSDGVQPDGLWQITLLFRDVPIEKARAEMQQRVDAIANGGIAANFEVTDLIPILANLVSVVRDGMLYIAEINFGDDTTTWPPEAKAWLRTFQDIQADSDGLNASAQFVNVQRTKNAEIGTLDMAGIRAYDETVGWPT